jgi:hypothetical protein
MNSQSRTLPMPRTLPSLTALVLVIAAGLVHGRWTNRWTTSDAVEKAVGKLGCLPMILGDWRGRSLEMNREQLALAEIAGCIARRYENRRTQCAVTVLLVCGRPGPISVHTPDICYTGAGFEPTGPLEMLSLPLGTTGPAASFRNAVFGKASAAVPTYLRILWSWSADGFWEAPDNPRLRFAPQPVLYKLYVIRELATADDRLEGDSSLDFLQTFLPELERVLFTNSLVPT